MQPGIRLAKVNSDEAQDISARFGIRGIPTLIAFRDGREVARQSGAMQLPALLSWIRANAHTIYHPVATCAMGRVVDTELRVRGLEGLRVVDASVMPSLVRGHTHAATTMIAERASDLIRGRS